MKQVKSQKLQKLQKKNEVFIPIFASFLFLIGILTALTNLLLFSSFIQVFSILIGCIYMFLAVSLAKYKKWAYTTTTILFVIIAVFYLFDLFRLISLYFKVDGLAPTSGILYLIFIAFLNLILNIMTILVLRERKHLFKK